MPRTHVNGPARRAFLQKFQSFMVIDMADCIKRKSNPELTEWDISSAKLQKAHGYSTPVNLKQRYEQAHQMESLAKNILSLSRNALLINLRFMESAFVRFVPGKELVTTEMATDGQFLYYNSAHICRQFKKDHQIPTRDYLHLVLHCLFRHLFVGKKIDGPVWDLACDIAVENLITGLHIKSLQCDREAEQAWLIESLKEKLPRLSAEHLYRYFLEQDLPPADIERLRRPFYADDHAIWHNKPEILKGSGENDENDPNEEGDAGQENDGAGGDAEMDQPEDNNNPSDENSLKTEAIEGDGSGGEGGSEGNKAQDDHTPALTPEELEQQWKDISERIQVALDTLNSSWGEGAGDMQQALTAINREKIDYSEFLRRFAALGENIQINDDEFDYIFYTYGMQIYDKMPLIEPLEYKEVKRIREFVIALDTSESVSGELVQKFVTKTWNILKQSENFFSTVNVHIIQCGAKVMEDVKITNEEEFDNYMLRMTLKGFGGTDFRPVFEHVDSLIRQHEFSNFKGLIYFTDGYGTFPAMPPAYEAAFVFVDTGVEPPEVPAWAMKLILSEDDIEYF